MLMWRNKFRFKRQSNGKGFSVSISDQFKKGEYKPKWQYKNLTKKQVFVMEQDFNNCLEQLFKGETLSCIGVPSISDRREFNSVFDFWMKEYLKGDQNSEVL